MVAVGTLIAERPPHIQSGRIEARIGLRVKLAQKRKVTLGGYEWCASQVTSIGSKKPIDVIEVGPARRGRLARARAAIPCMILNS